MSRFVKCVRLTALALVALLMSAIPVTLSAQEPINIEIEIDTIPANTGTVSFQFVPKNDGDTVTPGSGSFSISANPGPGYGFSMWEVEGDITVDDPTAAYTMCNVNGNGTLRMMQLPPPALLWTYPASDDEITHIDGITDIAVGELTGDVKEDVAAIDTPVTNATLHVLRGEGGLYWNKPIDGYSVAVGDIDGDGANEVVAARYNYNDSLLTNGIYAYRRNATGATPEMWFYHVRPEITDIEIGDIDGNPGAEVVACDRNGGIYVLNGSGNAVIGWPVLEEDADLEYPVYEFFMDLAIGQLDGQGGMDIAAIGYGPVSTLFVFNSAGVQLWYKEITGRTVEIGDVNGDGVKEVVAGTDDGYVMVYSGNGTEKYSFYVGDPVRPITDIELGDLDGNLANGLEVACITGHSLIPTPPNPSTLYALNIDNVADPIMWTYPMSWDSRIDGYTEYYGESLAIGDVDHDYKNEVVACSSISYHKVYAFDGLDNNQDLIGDLVWSPYLVEDISGLKITDLEIGDLDGDGDKDVVFGTFSYSGGCVYAIKAVDNTTVAATNSGPVVFDADPSSLENLQPVAENTLNFLGKPPYQYPHGFFSFKITGLDPGQTAIVTVTLPSPAPVGTKWVKCENGLWSERDVRINVTDARIISFDVTDGGEGDADGIINGTIVEPGGPGYPPPQSQPMGVGGEVAGVNPWGVLTPFLTLVLILAIGGAIVILRRPKIIRD